MLRRGFLAGCMASIAGAVRAEAPARVPRPPRRPEPGQDRATHQLIEAAKLSGTLAFMVADRATGRVLAAREADTPLPPASVAKTITSLYALEKLGPEFRFQTRVMRVGEVVQGRLEGDLYLVGGGDPNLDTDQLGDLVAAIAAKGIKEVTGRFIACDGALPSRFQIDAEQPEYLGYNPALCGLNLNYNRVNFEWKRAGSGYSLSMDARGERFLPLVKGAAVHLAARDLPVFAYEGDETWSVSQSALGDDGSRWLPVRRPGAYTAEVFGTLCATQGLTLPKAEITAHPPAEAIEVVAHQSEDLSQILHKMLRFSTNLTAEIVGLTASGAGSLEGSAAAMADWAQRRFGIAAVFGDHSGLGSKSRISAADLTQVMIRAGKARNGLLLAGLMREKGLVDAKGNETKASPVRIHAKSGTLNFVSNLAGYVAAPEGELAFAIIAADPARRAALSMEDREEPKGSSSWIRRARRLHQILIRRWADSYL